MHWPVIWLRVAHEAGAELSRGLRSQPPPVQCIDNPHGWRGLQHPSEPPLVGNGFICSHLCNTDFILCPLVTIYDCGVNWILKIKSSRRWLIAEAMHASFCLALICIDLLLLQLNLIQPFKKHHKSSKLPWHPNSFFFFILFERWFLFINITFDSCHRRQRI